MKMSEQMKKVVRTIGFTEASSSSPVSSSEIKLKSFVVAFGAE
jgi:hypothetical protein